MMSGATSAASGAGWESPKPTLCKRSPKDELSKDEPALPRCKEGRASRLCAASSRISQRGSSSERMGQKPLTSKPRTSPSAAGPLVAKLFEAAMRASGASASRHASAAARIAAFSARISSTPCIGDRFRAWRSRVVTRSVRTGHGNPVHEASRVALARESGAASAVEPSIPGHLQRRWAPYVRVQGPGQGQLPFGSIRARGYKF